MAPRTTVALEETTDVVEDDLDPQYERITTMGDAKRVIDDAARNCRDYSGSGGHED